MSAPKRSVIAASQNRKARFRGLFCWLAPTVYIGVTRVGPAPLMTCTRWPTLIGTSASWATTRRGSARSSRPGQHTPSGRLRVSLPRYSRLFEPAIATFMKQYPQVRLDLDFTDRMVDVIGEGYDAVVRSGEMQDSGLKRRRLGPFRRILATKSTSRPAPA
ncbi:LysR substrate-binding domain-containing protein [Lactiplantibacillus plantarum]|uniref:LysR substrate-binding domain-containing protein n=1 Tax=Lactiplantibacillus plantarum TaxID=1590 RepID=UPI004045A338